MTIPLTEAERAENRRINAMLNAPTVVTDFYPGITNEESRDTIKSLRAEIDALQDHNDELMADLDQEQNGWRLVR